MGPILVYQSLIFVLSSWSLGAWEPPTSSRCRQSIVSCRKALTLTLTHLRPHDASQKMDMKKLACMKLAKENPNLRFFEVDFSPREHFRLLF